MSMCLQSVVNELIVTKGMGSASQPATISTATSKQTKSNRVADWALKAVGGGQSGDHANASSKKKQTNSDFNQVNDFILIRIE